MGKLQEIIYDVIGGRLTEQEALKKAEAIGNWYAERGWLYGKTERNFEKAIEDIRFFAAA